MSELWSTLIPLAVASAVVPVQIVVTILLLQSSGGIRAAGAWVAGMTTTRLVQGLLFGLVFHSSDQISGDTSGPSPVESAILLVLAVLFYVTALKQVLRHEDPDAPPPRWMTMTASMKPGKAFLIGAGYVAVAAKLWVFTLGAAGAISDADLSRASSVLHFLWYVALAECVLLALLGMMVVAPTKSAAVLGRWSAWLERWNRVILIVLGLVFGTWFLIKALDGLGVI